MVQRTTDAGTTDAPRASDNDAFDDDEMKRSRDENEPPPGGAPYHGSSISASASGNAAQHPVSVKVRLKRFHAVAAWSWNANDDVCGICQAAFEGVCPGVKYPGEDCPVVWGKCGHAYHLQCVSKWLGQAASKNSCPICRQEWEFGQNPVNNTSSSNAATNAATASSQPASSS